MTEERGERREQEGMRKQDGVLMSAAYCPPVGWLSAAKRGGKVVIDLGEHYIKQTYRNRMRIATECGAMDLVIPVEKGDGKMAMRDVRMAKGGDWRRLHFRAIASAYGSSAFFEYYEDDFAHIYEGKSEFLCDFNMEMLNAIADGMGLRLEIEERKEYVCDAEKEGLTDLRNAFSPKKEAEDGKAYYQVFADRIGFQRGMSSADLLFNMGPESVLIL